MANTFREVHMGDFVSGSCRVTEIVDQFLHRWITRRDEVNGLHRRQRFTLLIDILYKGDTLSADIVHLATGGHHSHGELIHHQDPPFYPTCCLLLLLDHLVHNLCDVRELISQMKLLGNCKLILYSLLDSGIITSSWATMQEPSNWSNHSFYIPQYLKKMYVKF